MSARVYLDWNATAPLRPEARTAMSAAMDVVGNPSSVHGEGRAAKAILEKARSQVAEAIGASNADVVFTSGATEAAALALAGRAIHCAEIEHDCVKVHCNRDLEVGSDGTVTISAPPTSTLQVANSETGVRQDLPSGIWFVDAVQAFGKVPLAFSWLQAETAALSGHKIGGPKGVGALVLRQGVDVKPTLPGGGQEMGRRAGTENLIGIAGFGAAAEAAADDVARGLWEEVAERRDLLETLLADAVPDTIFIGQGAERLPNTSCIALPGWKGETQVMQMDLAGFAVSAGSACSSGKVKESKVLRAMGYDGETSGSAIRVSIGPQTNEAEIKAFALAWTAQYRRFRKRAA